MTTKSRTKSEVDDPFMDVAEAAAHLKQSERWVRRQVEERKIRYSKMGLHLRFRKSWLEEYIAETTVAPESE